MVLKSTTLTLPKLFCLDFYLPSVVGPATELEFAFLIIKREPCNVYLARALKDARRDVEAAPSLIDHHVRLERAVELFVGAVVVVMASERGRSASGSEVWLVGWFGGCFTMHG